MTPFHALLFALVAFAASLLVGWTLALAAGDAEALADGLAQVWIR